MIPLSIAIVILTIIPRPGFGDEPGMCLDSECDHSSLLSLRRGAGYQTSDDLSKLNRTGCRGAGNNCNAGECCAGLYCYPKKKNNGKYCTLPPASLAPMDPGTIPRGGISVWITEKLLAYVNSVLNPALQEGLSEVNTYMQSPEFITTANAMIQDATKDINVGASVVNIWPLKVKRIRLGLQQGAGLRISVEEIAWQVEIAVGSSFLGVAAGKYTFMTKEMSGLSFLVFMSSDDGALSIEVPQDYVVNTIQVKTSYLDDSTWSIVTPFGGTIANLAILGFMPTINKMLNKAMATLLPEISLNQEVVNFPTLPPVEVSGSIQGINTIKELLTLTISGAPLINSDGSSTPIQPSDLPEHGPLPDLSRMVVFRIHQDVFNGQFSAMAHLGLLSISKSFEKNPTWLKPLILANGLLPKVPCAASLFLQAPMLSLPDPNGKASLSVSFSINLTAQPKGKPVKSLTSYAANMTINVVPKVVQPPPSLLQEAEQEEDEAEEQEASVDSARSLLSSRSGTTTTCRKEGKNCNAGNCCSGLTCLGKESGLPATGNVGNVCGKYTPPPPPPAPLTPPPTPPTPPPAPTPPPPPSCLPTAGTQTLVLTLDVDVTSMKPQLPGFVMSLVKSMIPDQLCTKVALPGVLQNTKIMMIGGGWLQIGSDIEIDL